MQQIQIEELDPTLPVATRAVMLDRPEGAVDQPVLWKGQQLAKGAITSERRLTALHEGGSLVDTDTWARLLHDEELTLKGQPLIATPKSDRGAETFEDFEKPAAKSTPAAKPKPKSRSRRRA